ncbi:MAG: cation diffusion facilitator family transporter [Gemmatimonadetes bacterium]|nr:cation diffusion facilitator family transporter [Gemmatimonadota bacterium]
MTAHGHDHGPDHGHGHSHAGPGHGAHSHARDAPRRTLLIVLGITGAFMVAEFVGGLLSNSLALLADAAHMFTDVGALGLSLFAMWFAQRPATNQKTYGYLRLEILAALLNGATLIILSFFIFVEAAERLREPAEIRGGLMLAVAAGGLVVNLIAAFMLHRSAGENLNVRGAYLHVLGDLLGSVGAITAAVIILLTGWTLADPITSVLVGGLILISSWKLVRESVDILLEAVPSHLDIEEIHGAIRDIPGVSEVHDLHVWTVTSGYFAMSGHAVVDEPERTQAVLEAIRDRMHDRYGIEHVTVQVEQRRMYQIRKDGEEGV